MGLVKKPVNISSIASDDSNIFQRTKCWNTQNYDRITHGLYYALFWYDYISSP